MKHERLASIECLSCLHRQRSDCLSHLHCFLVVHRVLSLNERYSFVRDCAEADPSEHLKHLDYHTRYAFRYRSARPGFAYPSKFHSYLGVASCDHLASLLQAIESSCSRMSLYGFLDFGDLLGKFHLLSSSSNLTWAAGLTS